MALDTEALIVNRDGERIVPVGDIFLGYYDTSIADGELIAEVRVPLRPRWRSTHVKMTTRAALLQSLNRRLPSNGQDWAWGG
jgi:aerobic carbon-monoxide dehydrogenase medium subunit